MQESSARDLMSPAPSTSDAGLSLQDSHVYMDAVRLFCEGDYTGARRKFQSLLALHPEDARIIAACGHCCLHEGDMEKALDFYGRAERTGERSAETLYGIALIQLRQRQPYAARQQFTAILDSPPLFEAGKFYLGLLFQTREEFLADVCIYLGQIAREQEELDAARRWYERAITFRPDNVNAMQRLAEICILSKTYLEAINLLNLVLQLSPLEEDRINAHNNLGIACYGNGNLEEAVEHLTWVLRQAPTNPSAIFNLNHIYEKEGVFQRAERTPQAIRFMDVEESALPIFQLSGQDNESEQADTVIVGRSAEMLRVMRHARVAAASESPVLIRGESGSGKELLARLIARNSLRRDEPFAVVNCTSIPEMALESELFGHDKGAFTGARARRAGALEIAAGGTVFIDEIAALSTLLQGRIYRALREGKFLPMGASSEVAFEVRLICATKHDINALVREGKFREDLFYSLNIIPIDIPPLRERRADIPLLVDFFLQRYARRVEGSRKLSLPTDDLRILMEYEWPGNVRELQNLIERAVAMGSQSSLYLEEVARLRRERSLQRRQTQTPTSFQYPVDISLEELEKRHILAVLELTGNNQRTAARMLGINPSTLWRKLKAYGVSTND